MILPDSTIEVAARAACDTEADGYGLSTVDREVKWEHESTMWRFRARAALTAALPDLIEICAKVARGRCSDDEGLYCEGRCDAADSIRSLLTTPEDK